MKIELLDKPKWIERVNASLKFIADTRDKHDAAFLENWQADYDAKSWWGKKFATRDPLEADIFCRINYPSNYAWRDLRTLKRLLAVLNDGTVGVIHLSADEYRAAT